MKPQLIIQDRRPERVAALRSGLEQCDGVLVLGLDANVLSTLPGIDALFLTLPLAEAWGSRPLPAHVCEVLRTRERESKLGFPPYVVTGMVLKDDDPKTGRFVLPLLVRGILRAVFDFNARHANAIQTVGLTEVDSFAPDVGTEECGALVRKGVVSV